MTAQSWPQVLAAEESRLREQVGRVELLGELNLTEDYIARLEAPIAELLRSQGFTRATRWLREYYPHCLAVYLVAKGLFSYQSGEYWTQVRVGLGLREGQLMTDRWGRVFEDYVAANRLARIDVPGAFRYLTPILTHGGIPAHCLPDFFRYLLWPAVTQPALRFLSAAELIGEWLTAPAGHFPVDKPVLRFLEHGGELAVGLVERCLDLARQYAQTGSIAAPGEVGLPSHIVDAFAAWAATQGVQRAGADSVRMQRPQVTLDPWGQGVVAFLPAQQLAGDGRRPAAAWRIAADESIRAHPVRAFLRRDGWETESDEVILTGPAAEYLLTFEAGQGPSSTWRFPGITPRVPLLAFAAESYRLLPCNGALPAGEHWLLYPDDPRRPLRIPGGTPLEEAPPLPWQWSHYRCERWDLRRATEIIIGESRIAIQAEAASLRPRLVGGHPLDFAGGTLQRPVYCGAPPAIALPVASLADTADRLDRWTIIIRDGEGAIRAATDLANLAGEIARDDAGWRVPLSSPSLLGPRPCGAFEVQVRGPLGRDMTFSLSLVPELRLTGHDRVRLPGDAGQLPPARFSLITAPKLVVGGDDATEISVLRPGTYRVTVPAEHTEVALTIVDPDAGGEPARISVPLPSLRWALVDSQSVLGSSDWHTAPLSRAQSWIEQREAPQLVAMLAPSAAATETLSGRLLVVGEDNETLQQIGPDRAAGRWLSFPLAAALDTVRASGLARVEFELQLDNLAGHDQEITLPVLAVTRALKLEGLAFASELDGDDWNVSLAWERGLPLRHRRLRLWPLWRPWASPVELPIPAEATEGFRCALARADLPPGAYRAQVLVIDPWSGERLRRPATDTPNVLDVALGTDDEQVAYLAEAPDDLLGYLERALAASGGITIRALRHLHEMFDREHVGAALDAMLALSQVEDFPRALVHNPREEWQILRRLLGDWSLELVAEAAARVPQLDREEQQALRRLLLALGLLDLPLADKAERQPLAAEQLTILWHFWPPLAAALEGRALLACAPDAWSRAGTVLGLAGVGASYLASVASTSSPRPGPATLLALLTDGDCLGQAVEPWTLEAPATQLRLIWDMLQLVPSGLLDPKESWAAANFAWVRRTKERGALWKSAANWQEKHGREARAALRALGEHSPAFRGIAARLERRYDARWLDKPGNLPFVIGTVALAMRGLAHLPEVRSSLACDEDTWRKYALRALDFAPELFARDLCLIELLLAHELSTAAAMEFEYVASA